MKTIDKPKDNCFKLIFGNHELFLEFIRDFLKIDILKNVNVDDIEDVSSRFIPLGAESRDSDTVKKIRLPEMGGDIFVIALVEHESAVNFRIPFKMLRYISLILDNYESEVNKKKEQSHQKGFLYPPVLPIVFYDGESNWTAKMNFLEKTRFSDIFEKYIPKFEYELISLKDYDKSDIMKFGDVLSLVMLADKYSLGDMVALPGEYKEQISAISKNIPESLRQLLINLNTTLLRKHDATEEEIEAFTEIINTQGVKGMFEKWGDYSIREVRQQAREECRKEFTQHYEPLLAEKDSRVAALERELSELRKLQQAQT
jgi:hypothetical protein